MFGLPLSTILSLVITYAPKVVQLIQTLAPIIQAVAPVIEKMVQNGMTHEAAAEAVATHIGKYDMRSEESKRLDPGGGSFQGP